MKNMKKFVAIATALTMVIAPMTAFAQEATLGEYETDGDVNYANTTVYKVTLPTSAAWSFVLDPQGLTALDDGGTIADEDKGKIVGEKDLKVSNWSSVAVDVTAGFYITDTHDTAVTLVNSIANQDQKEVALAITAAGVNADVVANRASIGATTSTDIAVLSDDDAAPTEKEFVMAASTYEFVKDTSGDYEYVLTDSAVASTLTFTIGGNVAKDFDWSDYTGAEAKVISLNTVFTFSDNADSQATVTPEAEAVAPTDDYVMALQDNGTVTYTFVNTPSGSVTALKIDSADRLGAFTAGNITYVDGTLTCSSAVKDALLSTAGEHTIVITIGEEPYTLTYTATE